ncbi:MAG: D-alanyl-D-alanine carboxypeptidase family protein [Treponema sp.]|nr:D-alanyl-D-alanine carboxypeptidase family protein [Treponema sp.]
MRRHIFHPRERQNEKSKDFCSNQHGFVLRYQQGKEHISGYAYEPWHIRYVADKKLAQKLHDENLTLEEYRESLR